MPSRAVRVPRRALGLVAVALLGFASPQPPDAAAQSAPRAMVQQTIDAVLVILNDKALSTEQKRSRIETIAYQRFDFPTMSRLVLARNWQRFSKPQQTQFMDEFKRYLAVNYGNRIERYDQQKVDIVGERKEPRGDVTIQSIVRGGEFEGATVDYRLRESQGNWLVIDVIVEGISLVSNFRDQFKEVLARGGPEELLEALRAKNAAGPAEAS
ncbi:MAG: phospholipid-binding protein MlaC [Candidatus Limnocylindria bacterium]